MSEHGGAGRRWLRRAGRALWSNEPGAIELLLGPQEAVSVWARASSYWGTALAALVVIELSLPRAHIEGLHAAPTIVLSAIAVVIGLVTLRLRHRLTRRSIGVLVAGGSTGLLLELYLIGPDLGMGAVVPALGCVQAFLYFRRRGAVLIAAGVSVGYAVVLATRDGNAAPHLRWAMFTSAIGVSAAVIVWVVGLVERLAVQEREARARLDEAHAKLAEAHAQLEQQVDRQVEEIGSLRRLRQFLSPQVAEAVLERGMEALAPHRSRIAVVFCDLRGFTTFSSTAEPEEVMEVLDRYYVTVGRALQACHATVGTFAGDGIMAYFGDPVPHEDPAGTAVEMAVALRSPMREVVAGWRRRGFDLGCGMGIAYGYATIGPVGFDERTDYTALGPTVNLASRLCTMAEDDEILIDGRAFEAVEHRVRTEERVVQVRGFRAPVTAHNVLDWCTGSG
ncbi:MAG TPA: adenylate/guanylate cyclase domain-containing protein [Acidimicrobiales bacterium]|nr:adenylate/guanylate cyclase domain-containing protein [Acidimicrobiales bacterium]